MDSVLRARTLPSLLMFGALAPIAVAQTGAGNSFEVASVKTGGDPSRGMSMQTTPSGFSATNTTLKFLIQYAWDLKAFQISGGPGWMDSDRFTIEAKSDVKLDADHSGKYGDGLRSRLRSLLEDRFGLRVHPDERVMPVYELVVAGTGSKLSPAKDGSPEGWSIGSGMLKGTRVSAKTFARALSEATERVVIDRTGLTGYYDYTITWTPDRGTGPESRVSEQSDGPSIFTSVQEQLGLKLKAAKAPVEVLVIDRVEKPSQN